MCWKLKLYPSCSLSFTLAKDTLILLLLLAFRDGRKMNMLTQSILPSSSIFIQKQKTYPITQTKPFLLINWVVNVRLSSCSQSIHFSTFTFIQIRKSHSEPIFSSFSFSFTLKRKTHPYSFRNERHILFHSETKNTSHPIPQLYPSCLWT